MTRFLGRMAGGIRRELFAWILAGITLRWIWYHGFDWKTLLGTFAALGLHPAKENPESAPED